MAELVHLLIILPDFAQQLLLPFLDGTEGRVGRLGAIVVDRAHTTILYIRHEYFSLHHHSGKESDEWLLNPVFPEREEQEEQQNVEPGHQTEGCSVAHDGGQSIGCSKREVDEDDHDEQKHDTRNEKGRDESHHLVDNIKPQIFKGIYQTPS